MQNFEILKSGSRYYLVEKGGDNDGRYVANGSKQYCERVIEGLRDGSFTQGKTGVAWPTL